MNILKRALTLLLALSTLFLLCGCAALEQMRQEQAFIDQETGYITWNGATYQALSHNEYFTIESESNRYVYATEPDVPVLLSQGFAERTLIRSDDDQILWDYRNSVYYCESSAYEEMNARIKAPFQPEIVCYSYSVYNEETYDYDTLYYTLTQEQVEAIELVVQNTEPTVLGDGMFLEEEYCISLQECSEDMLFRRGCADISVNGSTYYLHLYTNDGTVLFIVPEGCKAVFDEIVKAYITANDPYFYKTQEEDL